ncbi:hypothetical protein H5P28_13095 [Ruficoccus amylovorans]|uniref:Uncharacterized protein n=1 Tax=Ruficoccus amylovorans TaxID=1804625 RepID=A0A842HI34_9BACT|nr:hypothetical protein [Ruficoccus amylovorans]MBC2595197.1 hypothetical protein [Ruficoccus amylovorans]
MYSQKNTRPLRPLGVTRDLVHPAPQGMLEIGNYVGAAIKRILARRAGDQ